MKKTSLKLPIIILASILVMGGIGFHLIEGIDIATSFYWTISTVTTVGYGDVVPQTEVGRVFASVLMVVGIGAILYALTIVGKNIIEGRLWSMVRGSEKEKEVKKMKDHLIICGYGQIGQTITQDLLLGNEKVIIIDKDEEVLRREASDLPYIVGDPTHEEVLEKARIDKAKGLFTTFSDDSDNILVTLSAKEVNPDIRVISRASDDEGIKHLRRAGAEAVILPEREGGLRMSRSFLHPEITDLYEYLISGEKGRAGAVEIPQRAELDGKTIEESGVREKIGVSVVAIRRGKEIITNPKPDQEIKAGDTLITLGTIEQIQKLKELAGETSSRIK
ncbi:MAG: potassium channel family protein [Thermodesulfobacteriota bacterium]